MDLNQMLVDLREQKTQVEEAILSLERLAAGTRKRRGRPPAWIAALKKGKIVSRRGRPSGSKNPARFQE